MPETVKVEMGSEKCVILRVPRSVRVTLQRALPSPGGRVDHIAGLRQVSVLFCGSQVRLQVPGNGTLQVRGHTPRSPALGEAVTWLGDLLGCER